MIPARISSTEHNKGLDLTLTPSALDCVTTIYNKCAPLGREIVYLCVSEEGRVIDFLVGKLFIILCMSEEGIIDWSRCFCCCCCCCCCCEAEFLGFLNGHQLVEYNFQCMHTLIFDLMAELILLFMVQGQYVGYLSRRRNGTPEKI